MTPEIQEFLFALFGLMTFAALGLALWSCHMTIKSSIRVAAMEKATHSVQYVPLDPEDADEGAVTAALRKREREAFEAGGDLDDETFHAN